MLLSANQLDIPTSIFLNHMVVFPATREIERLGIKIRLRKKEFELLEFLIHNRDRMISRSILLEYVWHYDSNANSKTLEVHMSSLRSKVDKNFDHKLIETIHGYGYRLNDLPDLNSARVQLQLF